MNYNIFLGNQFLLSKDKYKALSKLSQEEKITQNDYMLAWWDYGWPMWYVTGISTIIDNGLHHKDNYFVSKAIFARNGNEAYKYTLFTIEKFIEARKHGYHELSDYLFKKLAIDTDQLEKKVLDYRRKYINRGYFVYFDDRYLQILRIIYDFSNINLKNGNILNRDLFLIGRDKKYSSDKIFSKDKKIKSNIIFYKNNGVLLINNKNIMKIKVARYIDVDKNIDKSFKDGDIYVIDYKEYFLALSKRLFDSFFIQTHILHNIDEHYFDRVSAGKNFTILKLKKADHE